MQTRFTKSQGLFFESLKNTLFNVCHLWIYTRIIYIRFCVYTVYVLYSTLYTVYTNKKFPNSCFLPFETKYDAIKFISSLSSVLNQKGERELNVHQIRFCFFSHLFFCHKFIFRQLLALNKKIGKFLSKVFFLNLMKKI